jgi:hypothetical protein
MAYPACAVSSPFYAVGERVWVYGRNTDRLELCTVVDVSHPKDRARHIRTRRIAELGFREARRLCGARAMGEPPTRCPILVVKL